MLRSWFRNSLAAAAVLSLSTVSVHAQYKRGGINLRASTAVMEAFKPAVAAPSKSTVRVRADGQNVALGTIVGADGWILTKFDQVKDAAKITCKLKDGRELDAKLVGVHVKNDLALLKVQAKDLTPIQWLDSNKAAVGNWVATPGPSDLPISVGVVSVATRKMSAGEYPPSPVPANSGFLGVTLGPGDGGAKIIAIMKDGAAEKAGIKANDVVEVVAGQKIDDPDTMISILRNFKVGEKVTLKVLRGEERLDVEAKLEKRPAGLAMNRSLFQNSMGREISRKNSGFPIALQHDTVLNATDCGGPLVNLDGKAVGVNIASAGRVDSYAIPAEIVKSLLPDLMSGRMPPPPPVKKEQPKTEKKEESKPMEKRGEGKP